MTFCPRCGEPGRENESSCRLCGGELAETVHEPARPTPVDDAPDPLDFLTDIDRALEAGGPPSAEETGFDAGAETFGGEDRASATEEPGFALDEFADEPEDVTIEAPPPAFESETPSAAPPAHRAPLGRIPLAVAVAGCVGAGLVLIALFGASPAADEPETAGAATAPAAVVPSAAAPSAPAVLPRAAWTRANEARWVSNHPRSVAFELAADRHVAVWMSRVRPLLVVRCLARTTDVFVFTESAAAIEPQDENHTVRLAFDGGSEETARWPDSAEHDALFAPDGLAFARRLAGARTFRFGFTPHNSRAVAVEFTLTGVDEAIAPVAKACGWKLEG